MTSKIYKNIERFLREDIAFNDMVRCQVTNNLDPILRYKSEDAFSHHFYLIGNIAKEHVYPSVGVRFGGILQDYCANYIRVQFLIRVRQCLNVDNDCNTQNYCGLKIVDPVAHIDMIGNHLISIFDYEKTDINGVMTSTTLFEHLMCKEMVEYICDANGVITPTAPTKWEHSMLCSLVGNPARTEMQAKDCYWEQLISLNLRIDQPIVDCSCQ